MGFNIEFAQTEQQFKAWNDFVLSCPCTSFFSTTNWLDSYTLFGVQTRYLVAAGPDGAIVGGAPLVVFRMGPWRWIQIPHGPCISPLKVDVLPQLLDAIENYAVEIGAMFVQASPFEPSPHHGKWEERAKNSGLAYDPRVLKQSNCGISEALVAAGFEPGVYSGLIKSPRAGQIVQLDVEDLMMSFRKGTRRDIRHSLRNDLVVRSASSLDELEVAYHILKENAARQQYSVRPWPAFRKAIWPGIESDGATVLMAEYHSEVVATVVVLFGGRRGYYVMGGTKRLNCRNVYPAHLLQYLAMQHVLKRGYSQYDLSAVVGGGVADFKRGFRPTYYHLADPLTKVYRQVMTRSYRVAYPHMMRYRRGLAKMYCAFRSLLERR